MSNQNVVSVGEAIHKATVPHMAKNATAVVEKIALQAFARSLASMEAGNNTRLPGIAGSRTMTMDAEIVTPRP